jgi:hypothetical protein
MLETSLGQQKDIFITFKLNDLDNHLKIVLANLRSQAYLSNRQQQMLARRADRLGLVSRDQLRSVPAAGLLEPPVL